MSRAPLVSAVVLALGLLAGGVRTSEAVILAALGGLAALVWRARGGESPEGPRARWLDAALVLGVTTAFVAASASLPARDVPLGLDWFAYLRNVVVLATGEWDAWQRWRAPFHAVVVLGMVRPAGGLIEASQLVSLVSLALCLPLTFWLGRMLLGPWPARFAVVLLAGWPEARLFARFSTPYALLAVLFLAGLALVVAALSAPPADRSPRWKVPLAGVLLGLAMVTDVRGAGLAALAVGGAVAAAPWLGVRALAVAGGVGAVALGVHTLAFAVFPVELVPLTEQIALQRDLNATEGARTCLVGASAIPSPAELVGPCARETLATNVGRAQDALPVSLAFLVPLVLLGLRPLPGQPRWAPVALVLPLVGTLPSVLLVGFQHRYAVPLAPLVALLAANTLHGLAAPRPAARGLVAVLILSLLVAWERWPGTPLARAWTGSAGSAGAAPSVILGASRGLVRVREILRVELRPDDRLVDCAHAGLRMRMFPSPVDELSVGGRASPRCAGLRTDGPGAAPTRTWLLTAWSPPDAPSPAWEVVYSWPRGPETAALLRADPAP